MKTNITLLLILATQLLYGQCNEDRHNTSLSSTWRSCELSASPNPNRGDSHWISYDLGEVKKLQQGQFWNINNPTHLTDGARQIAIDYSNDGSTWNSWRIWEAPQAEGSGFYEGVPGPDFDGLQARYLLLTILNNHGGDCYGFGEIRLAVDQISSSDDLDMVNSNLVAYPNPASEFTNLKITTSYSGAASLDLLDLGGKLIATEQITLTGRDQEIRYNLAAPASGQYLIRIRTDKAEYSTELSVIKNQ